MNRLINGLLAVMLCSLSAEAQMQIRSFDDIAALIRQKNTVVRNGNVELEKARKAELAGLFGIPDPTGSVSAGYTNNIQLPVSLFPAEILGGTPGTFERIRLGTRYNSDVNGAIYIKLLNLQGIQNYHLAKINTGLTEAANRINLKSILDNATAIYYNLHILRSQQLATQKYLSAADTLQRYVMVKYQHGLAAQQDLNDVKITRLNYAESLAQIRYQIDYQLSNLKTVIGIPVTDSLQVDIPVTGFPETEPPVNTQLNEINNRLRHQLAETEYKKEKYSFLPTFSLQAGYRSNLYDTKPNPFNSDAGWIPSSYVGLKLAIPVPSAGQISNYSRLKYEKLMQFNSIEQARQQDVFNQSALSINLQKANAESESKQTILALRKDNYTRNVLNYEAGLITLEQTINSLNALIDAEYAGIAARYKVGLAIQNIKNHNSIR